MFHKLLPSGARLIHNLLSCLLINLLRKFLRKSSSAKQTHTYPRDHGKKKKKLTKTFVYSPALACTTKWQ